MSPAKQDAWYPASHRDQRLWKWDKPYAQLSFVTVTNIGARRLAFLDAWLTSAPVKKRVPPKNRSHFVLVSHVLEAGR